MIPQSKNIERGIDTAVLTQESIERLNESVHSDDHSQSVNEGLFLVSNSEPIRAIEKNIEKGQQKLEKTRNRKRAFFDSEYIHNGTTYRVNSKGSGLYEEILQSMIEQFEIAAQIWRRVFVLRFDLHMDTFTEDNKLISNFRNRLTQKLKRTYGFDQVGFCWAREIERAKSQHYHWVLFLDGKLIRHSSKIIKLIKAAWEDISEGFHVPVISNPFHVVQNQEDAAKAVYRISYLAKVRGKGYRPPQTNDFSCSRMKFKR